MYDLNIVKREQQQTSSWTGGTTTQIYIFPIESAYAERNFLWRLSTAVVQLEQSSFTKLPGYDRHLMVLEGELRIVHKNQYAKSLKQYEQDSFKGGWDTVSYGQARDFNLMLKEGLQGSLKHYFVDEQQNLELALNPTNKQCFFAYYCCQGQLSISIEDRNVTIEAGDILLISFDEVLKLAVKGGINQKCSFIAAFIEV